MCIGHDIHSDDEVIVFKKSPILFNSDYRQYSTENCEVGEYDFLRC